MCARARASRATMPTGAKSSSGRTRLQSAIRRSTESAGMRPWSTPQPSSRSSLKASRRPIPWLNASWNQSRATPSSVPAASRPPIRTGSRPTARMIASTVSPGAPSGPHQKSVARGAAEVRVGEVLPADRAERARDDRAGRRLPPRRRGGSVSRLCRRRHRWSRRSRPCPRRGRRARVRTSGSGRRGWRRSPHRRGRRPRRWPRSARVRRSRPGARSAASAPRPSPAARSGRAAGTGCARSLPPRSPRSAWCLLESIPVIAVDSIRLKVWIQLLESS